MKILVIGSNGQIGSALIKELKNHKVDHLNKEQLDCTNLEGLKNFFINKSYDYVINAVAYTNVDQAEVDTDKAKLLNAIYPNELSKILKKMNCALIHYSTDYVFDGTKTSDYFEQSTPNPLNVYSKTKLLGDLSILKQKLNGYIFFLNLKPINISSQEIRKEIGEGKNIKELTTSKVINYIKNHKLYLREGQEK